METSRISHNHPDVLCLNTVQKSLGHPVAAALLLINLCAPSHGAGSAPARHGTAGAPDALGKL